MSPRQTARLTVVFLLFAGLWCRGSAQPPRAVSLAAGAELNTEEIVENLVAMDLERAQALHAYQVSEAYHLAYRGFLGARTASMVLNVKYRSPGTTAISIQSSSGSTLILNKVFKKLLRADRQELAVKAQKKAALNRINYDFELTGQERTQNDELKRNHEYAVNSRS
jgi:hypothetical protein